MHIAVSNVLEQRLLEVMIYWQKLKSFMIYTPVNYKHGTKDPAFLAQSVRLLNTHLPSSSKFEHPIICKLSILIVIEFWNFTS